MEHEIFLVIEDQGRYLWFSTLHITFFFYFYKILKFLNTQKNINLHATDEKKSAKRNCTFVSKFSQRDKAQSEHITGDIIFV